MYYRGYLYTAGLLGSGYLENRSGFGLSDVVDRRRLLSGAFQCENHDRTVTSASEWSVKRGPPEKIK